jgi:hypothetical protein
MASEFQATISPADETGGLSNHCPGGRMRILKFLSLTILSVMLGASAFLCAQDEKQQPDQPRQEDVKPSKQDEAKPPKQDEAKPSHQDEAKPTKQEKQEDKDLRKQDQNRDKAMHDHAAPEHPEQPNGQAPEHQDQMHPAQAGNAGPSGKGGHIPDQQFHAHFGHQRRFRANTVIVSGQPQFQYSGYTFELVDAWPADWAYTDDCYIDYIDGEYFLFDLLHPGMRIAVIVVM